MPRKGIAWPQSQFPHSCVCERSLYSYIRPTYFPAAQYADRSGEYVTRSQKHECTLIKKKINFFPIYKEIQSGAVAKSYMRKGFLIYEEMGNYFPIYKEAVSYIWLCNCSILNFLIYGDILIFFFISVGIGTVATQFLSWEYLVWIIFGIASL